MLTAASEESLEGTVIGLIIVAIVAVVVYGACHLAGRPDWGRIGAALVIVVGGLLVLLEAL